MPSLRTPRRAVAAAFILNGALFGVWASRIPAVASLHDLGPGRLGLLLLLMAAGAIVSFPLAGRAVDRAGARDVTLRVAVAYTIALFALALAPDVTALAIALLAFGATHGAMDVAMNAWAGEVERGAGRPLMSSFHAMFSLGAGAGAGSGFAAVSLGLGLATHFLVVGAVVATATLALAWIDWAPERRRGPGHAPVFGLPRGALLAVGVIAFCSALGEGAMADWSAIFLTRTTGVGEAHATLGYAGFSVAMVVMRLAGDRVIGALGPVVAGRVAGATAALGATLSVAVAAYPAALAGFVLLGAGYAMIMPLAFSRAANDPHVPPGAALAQVSTLGYGGLLLGPPVIGFIAEGTSIRIAFLLLAVLAALIVAMATAIRAPARANTASAAGVALRSTAAGTARP